METAQRDCRSIPAAMDSIYDAGGRERGPADEDWTVGLTEVPTDGTEARRYGGEDVDGGCRLLMRAKTVACLLAGLSLCVLGACRGDSGGSSDTGPSSGAALSSGAAQPPTIVVSKQSIRYE